MSQLAASRIRFLTRSNPLSIFPTVPVLITFSSNFRRSYAVHADADRPASLQVSQAESGQTLSEICVHHATVENTRPDPYKLLAQQLSELQKTLPNLLGASHPALAELARYYFLRPSKQLRPLLVLLFAQATNGLGAGYPEFGFLLESDDSRNHLSGSELASTLISVIV